LVEQPSLWRRDFAEQGTMKSASETTANATVLNLSPANQVLLNIIVNVQFGRIEQLHIRAGQAILEPPPCIIRSIKLAERPHRTENPEQDFVLKQAFVDLFRYIGELDAGVVERIEIRHGQPLLVEICQRITTSALTCVKPREGVD
jgi:hypothetical protein